MLSNLAVTKSNHFCQIKFHIPLYLNNFTSPEFGFENEIESNKIVIVISGRNIANIIKDRKTVLNRESTKAY